MTAREQVQEVPPPSSPTQGEASGSPPSYEAARQAEQIAAERAARDQVVAEFRTALHAQAGSFVAAWNQLAATIYAWNRYNGFWPDDGSRSFPEVIALCHSELSEALESHREGNPPSKKAVGFTSIEEEFADLLIRSADASAGFRLRTGEAVIAKALFNLTRPQKHGKAY